MRYASPFQKGCFIAMPSVSLMQFDLISIANANLTKDSVQKRFCKGAKTFLDRIRC